MPPANAQAREDASAFLERVAGIDIAKCPHCQRGRWLTISAPKSGRLTPAATVRWLGRTLRPSLLQTVLQVLVTGAHGPASSGRPA